MKKSFLLIIAAFVIGQTDGISQNPFCLPPSNHKSSKSVSLSLTESAKCRPFTQAETITGLSISGSFHKSSPEYLVRVLLKDTDGKEYLILESYEEINNDSIVSFACYCEETAFLDQIVPDSMKVFLKDATLQIDEIQMAHDNETQGGNIAKLRQERRQAQCSNIIERINNYNRANKRLWGAGDTKISHLDYQTKTRTMGIADNESSGGIEYYVGGIFELRHSTENYSNTDPSLYVDNWDWRNINGIDWITSIKDQDTTSFCTTFAVAACLEAQINLYYNRKIDLDLSEMELACCSDSFPHLPNVGFSIPTVMDYVVEHGLCDESSYPFVVTNTPSCLSDSITPLELVRANGVTDIYGSAKKALIKHGPLVVHLSQGIFSPGHAMLLVGYGTLHENDVITYMYNYQTDHYETATLMPGDNRIGKTFWILKNSWGTESIWNTTGGYIYILDNASNMFTDSSTFSKPYTTLNYTDDDIVIEDLDGDGYYNWGLGARPSSCPVWIPERLDRDDSDPTKSYMDDYGNFPETYTFPMGTDIIYNNYTISGNESLIKDIKLYHGVTLTVTGSAYCLENVKIDNSEGIIIIDGGVLANAKIVMGSDGKVIIRNGGSIYMKKDVDFEVPIGCQLEIEEGQILPPYRKKTEL